MPERIDHGRALPPLVGLRNAAQGLFREFLGGNDTMKMAEETYASLEKSGNQEEIQFAARTAANAVFTPDDTLLRLAQEYAHRAHKGAFRTIGRMVVSSTVGLSFDMASDLIQMAELTAEDQRRQTKAINGIITITDASPVPTPGLDVHLTRNASQKHTQEVRTEMLIKGLQVIADPLVPSNRKQAIINIMGAKQRGEDNPFFNVSLLALDNKIGSLNTIRQGLQAQMSEYKRQYDDLEKRIDGRFLRIGTAGLIDQQDKILKQDAPIGLQEVLIRARVTDLMLLRAIRNQSIAQGLITPHPEFDLPYLQ